MLYYFAPSKTLDQTVILSETEQGGVESKDLLSG